MQRLVLRMKRAFFSPLLLLVLLSAFVDGDETSTPSVTEDEPRNDDVTRQHHADAVVDILFFDGGADNIMDGPSSPRRRSRLLSRGTKERRHMRKKKGDTTPTTGEQSSRGGTGERDIQRKKRNDEIEKIYLDDDAIATNEADNTVEAASFVPTILSASLLIAEAASSSSWTTKTARTKGI